MDGWTDGARKYFNIVDLCGILPYDRMCPHLCGLKYYIQLYLISIFILQSIRLGPKIVCNDQLNRARAVILLPAHPASFAHKFLFQRVTGCNSIADLSLKIVC